MSCRRYKKSMLIHLLNAVKAFIPSSWKNSNPLTLRQWFSQVNDIQEMEYLITPLRGKKKNGKNLNAPPDANFEDIQDFFLEARAPPLFCFSSVVACSSDVILTSGCDDSVTCNPSPFFCPFNGPPQVGSCTFPSFLCPLFSSVYFMSQINSLDIIL